jgi:hypothetical protein
MLLRLPLYSFMAKVSSDLLYMHSAGSRGSLRQHITPIIHFTIDLILVYLYSLGWYAFGTARPNVTVRGVLTDS